MYWLTGTKINDELATISIFTVNSHPDKGGSRFLQYVANNFVEGIFG
jgi:hypothetical protein